MNEHLSEKFSRNRKLPPPANTSSDPNHSKDQLNRDIRAYVTAANIPKSKDVKPWLLRAEIPTSEEILDNEDEPVQLAENRLDKPWGNRKKYLETHYELLREDAIAPLRDAVHQFKSTPNMADDGKVAIYDKVYICGVTFAPQGLATRIQFSTARAGKSIAWQYSKRLISGSLVALTPANDRFQDKCLIATVAARPNDLVKQTPSQVDLFFARPEEMEIDPQKEFVMIESRSGYYEGSRHTLKALQKLHQERFPFAEHICNLKTDVSPPTYLERSPIINTSSAFENTDQKKAAMKCDILRNWPTPPEDTLDHSQWSALHQILSARLSIVQGPPGTGKTHVSVVGLRILLENKSSSDPPIIVAAQTNHALDQILRHVSEFDDNYIRLGGRSQDDEIKKHTLYEIKKKDEVRPPVGSIFGRAMKEQSDLARKMVEIISPLIREGASHPLAPNVLCELAVITPSQARLLVAGASQWVSSLQSDPPDPTSLWLNKQLVPFEVLYEQNPFGFPEDEKDEEYEQLKELEAERGNNDDDDIESLRGLFHILEDKFTCHTTPSYKAGAEAQLAKHSDLWNIPQRARGGVYRLLQERAKASILARFRAHARRYAELCQNVQIGRWERDAVVLEKANVIGMTTTGFSKYRPLVASLKPKIVLIEEAAEVIEGPVTVVCVESLEHLILVGDHQQLQGHCNVPELEEVFHLNVSMFERLVRNDMPFKTLSRQRRMDPEIRRALAPIYPDLEDHPSVIGRPSVPGMGDVRSFFFDHNWSEGSDSMMSKYNEQEAEFVVGCFCYLVRGGIVKPRGITVLTFYNGQRKLILKLLKQQDLLAGEYLSVNTVDSYQGEESTVVLLSLVRSNEQGTIGFLEVANRVCVALSRAQLGFYIFGNATLLSKDPLWDQVLTIMANNPNRVGDRFPIECIKHNRKSEIKYPRDWDGRFGCNLKCGEVLDCGHKCPLTCHSFEHDIVICEAECKRPLICGHFCNKKCSMDCSCKSECADFIRLSEHPDIAIETSQSRRHKAWKDPNIDCRPVPMEVRSNNRLETDPAIHVVAGIPTRIIPPTHNSRITASTSGSATSDPFGRASPEKQLQSRTNWDAFARGGVQNDDLLRDKGAMDQKQKLVEQSMDLLALDSEPPSTPKRDKKTIDVVERQTEKSLRNGRVRRDHEYLLPIGNSPRKLYGEGSVRKQKGVAKQNSEATSLIDFD